MTASGWWWRGAAAVVTWAACLVVGARLELEPDAVRLLLLVLLLVALAGLMADTVVDPPVEWHHDHPDREDWRGHDQRTAFYVRMVESHLTGRDGDPAVRDRLVRLAEQTWQTRRGRGVGSEGYGDLGGGWARLATEPPRRLTREELDQWLTTIERIEEAP